MKTEVRYQGKEVRTFTVFPHPRSENHVSVVIRSGRTQNDGIAQEIKRYGAREVASICIQHERWHHDITKEAAKKRLKDWRKKYPDGQWDVLTTDAN